MFSKWRLRLSALFNHRGYFHDAADLEAHHELKRQQTRQTEQHDEIDRLAAEASFIDRRQHPR